VKRARKGMPAAAILAGGISRHGASCSCRICVAIRDEDRKADLVRARELAAAGAHDEARVLFAKHGIQLHTTEAN
jgi:hypothetical protein